jgi:2-methylisocitrate lyase-like PEP mutase family enzyme
MTKDEQRIQAERFLGNHQAPPILVLPNAWDVISARLFELEGFKAIGTTSAGISATLGYADGQRMTLDENLAVVRRIAGQVQIPVSADLEAGYATSVEGVVQAARAALEADAVGINLEDGTGEAAAPLIEIAAQVEKIAAIRELASSAGIPLVINARTDVYLTPEDDPLAHLRSAVERGAAYRQAGADCIFVPDMGDLDREAIARLVEEIDAPINLIAGARTPPLAELEDLGVARVSLGPRPMRAALALVRKIARELNDAGTYTRMTAEALTYAEVNAMLAK